MDKITIISIIIIFLLLAILDTLRKLHETSKGKNINQDITASDINHSIDSIQAYLDDIALQLRKINYRLEHIAKDYDPSTDDENIEEEQNKNYSQS